MARETNECDRRGITGAVNLNAAKLKGKKSCSGQRVHAQREGKENDGGITDEHGIYRRDGRLRIALS